MRLKYQNQSPYNTQIIFKSDSNGLDPQNTQIMNICQLRARNLCRRMLGYYIRLCHIIMCKTREMSSLI